MATRKAREREHDFALVLSGITELTPKTLDALYTAGCDDATLSIRSGRVYATFSRTAETLKDAILSAIRDVRRAKVGADVMRVDECNLVTQADIARKIKRSRQLVHQYMTGKRGPGNFPPPTCHVSDESPLWHWCEVAHWLWENQMIEEEVVRQAEWVDHINAVLELRHLRQVDPKLADEVLDSIGSGIGSR